MKIWLASILLLVSISGPTFGSDSGNYFRVWQGFQRTDMSRGHFLFRLPELMNDTVALYDPPAALNNYFVAIPPDNKPEFIGDELALIALSSESDYRKIRATPEGQDYSDLHWELFDKQNSSSAKTFINYWSDRPSSLQDKVAYDMIGKNIDWRIGETYVYIGIRKMDVNQNKFKSQLKTHIENVSKSFSKKGLRGYIVVSTGDYEITYINWSSEDAMERAFGTEEGKARWSEAEAIMAPLMFEKAQHYKGGPVEAGKVYKSHRDTR